MKHLMKWKVAQAQAVLFTRRLPALLLRLIALLSVIRPSRQTQRIVTEFAQSTEPAQAHGSVVSSLPAVRSPVYRMRPLLLLQELFLKHRLAFRGQTTPLTKLL